LFLKPLQRDLDQWFVVGQVNLQCEMPGSTIFGGTFLRHGHFQKKVGSSLILSPIHARNEREPGAMLLNQRLDSGFAGVFACKSCKLSVLTRLGAIRFNLSLASFASSDGSNAAIASCKYIRCSCQEASICRKFSCCLTERS